MLKCIENIEYLNLKRSSTVVKLVTLRMSVIRKSKWFKQVRSAIRAQRRRTDCAYEV